MLKYEDLRKLVDNKLIVKPHKLTTQEFFSWVQLYGTHSFFTLLPYVEFGGCIRLTDVMGTCYIKLCEESNPILGLFENGVFVREYKLNYSDIVSRGWQICYETYSN